MNLMYLQNKQPVSLVVPLEAVSRPQDAQHIQSMLKSPDRQLWDLRVLVWEACESARRQTRQFFTPGISIT
jgi:hypothetical protein